VGEGDVELPFGPVQGERGIGLDVVRPVGGGIGVLGNFVPVEEVAQELAVSIGNQAQGITGAEAPVGIAGVAGRDDQVHAVGAVADLVLDPGQVHLEGLVTVADGAEDAEAAGLRDGGDDVAAVAEREDRELDPEHLRDRCLHQASMIAQAVRPLPVRRGRARRGGPRALPPSWR
jgi:hypothetical protein